MFKRKDNLTDLVEQIPKVEVSGESKPSKNQQVVDKDGDVVTLAGKPSKTKQQGTNDRLFELSEKDIKHIVCTAIEQTTDAIVEQATARVIAKLKDRGLI
jgi:hypothetical protein